MKGQSSWTLILRHMKDGKLQLVIQIRRRKTEPFFNILKLVLFLCYTAAWLANSHNSLT